MLVVLLTLNVGGQPLNVTFINYDELLHCVRNLKKKKYEKVGFFKMLNLKYRWRNETVWTLISAFSLNKDFLLLSVLCVNGFQIKCPLVLHNGIMGSTFFLLSFSFSVWSIFPMSQLVVGKTLTLFPKPLNEPEGSMGHVKSTTGQLWHCSQLLGLSKSVISALSNVLWGSHCMIDLTQQKLFYPLRSYKTNTTNPAWKPVALSPLSLLRWLPQQKRATICAPHCNFAFVFSSLVQYMVSCNFKTREKPNSLLQVDVIKVFVSVAYKPVGLMFKS